MFSHRVEISPPALQDAHIIFSWLSDQYGSEVSNHWFNGLFEAINSLERLPRRCPLAPESKKLDREIRQLLYARGRIVFGLQDDVVRIYRIRHQAQRLLKSDDFPKE